MNSQTAADIIVWCQALFWILSDFFYMDSGHPIAQVIVYCETQWFSTHYFINAGTEFSTGKIIENRERIGLNIMKHVIPVIML